MSRPAPATPDTLSSSDGEPQTLADVLLALEQGDFQRRWEVARHLPQYGQAAIAALMQWLQDPDEDWELRWLAARTLGDFDAPQVIPALLQVIQQNPEPDLLAAAAEALGNLGTAGITALGHCLQQPQQRSQAVQVLARMGHSATIAPLLTVVQDEDSQNRATAIAALGQFRDDRLPPIWLVALGDPAPAVRRAAVTSLGRWPDCLPPADLCQWLYPRLWDDALGVQQAAASALGRLGSAGAIAHLAAVLQRPDSPEPLQLTVVAVLGWQPSEAVLTILRTAWPTASPAVQLEMITTLGAMAPGPWQHPSQVLLQDWLRSVLSDATATAQKQAISLALGHLQADAARPLLTRLTTDPNPQVRLHGEAALRLLALEPEDFSND